MQPECNSKVTELQEVVRHIKSQELILEQTEKSDSPEEKTAIEKNINELKFKKNRLNEELIENEENSENTRMKYAIMILLNFGNEEPEYSL